MTDGMLEGILIVALVGFGLSYAQAKMEGPFGISDMLRVWVNEHNTPGWVKNGVSCPYCLSFWFTLLGALLLLATGSMSPAAFLVTWLAGYGLSCFGLLYVGV